jgi:hypothetical protein
MPTWQQPVPQVDALHAGGTKTHTPPEHVSPIEVQSWHAAPAEPQVWSSTPGAHVVPWQQPTVQVVGSQAPPPVDDATDADVEPEEALCPPLPCEPVPPAPPPWPLDVLETGTLPPAAQAPRAKPAPTKRRPAATEGRIMRRC